MLREGMEYGSEAQNNYKNQYINNKNDGKEGKHHSSIIVYSVSIPVTTGENNQSITKEK